MTSSATRILVLLMFAPVAFEATVRLDDWTRYGVPLTSGATTLLDLRIEDSLGMHARPGTAFRKFHINQLGFRGPETTQESLHDGPLVVVSGASETFGLYESDNREWPRQLGDSLASRCTRSNVTVLNSAFAGMSMPTVAGDIARRISALRPDVVVYYPQPSQYLYGTSPSAVKPSGAPNGPLAWWRLRAPGRIRQLVKAETPAPVLEYLRVRDTEHFRQSGETVFPEVPRDRLDSLESHLRLLIGTVRTVGAMPVLVLPVHRFGDTTSIAERRWLRVNEREFPKVPASMWLSFAELANGRVRRVAGDSSVPLAVLDITKGPERALYFADPVHFTDLGAAVAAKATSDAIAPLISCGGQRPDAQRHDAASHSTNER